MGTMRDLMASDSENDSWGSFEPSSFEPSSFVQHSTASEWGDAV